jgi:GT2 family glycosyltransferase
MTGRKIPSIYIVTPVFNKRELALRFVKSIKKQNYPNFKLTIVDDGSTDGTGEALKKMHPEVTVLQGDGNLWWSGGTNVGVRYAIKHQADYILTINHDVTLKPDYLSSLIECANSKPNSLIGSMIVRRDDHESVWFFGGDYSKSSGLNNHILGQASDFTEPTSSVWLTGMGVLVPSEVFRKVGFYDEKNFPLYFGDADFSERARRAGFGLWVNPKSIVYADTDDNWVGRNVKRPRVRFIYDLFTLINSPFQWRTRHLFYKKYWPGNYRLALVKFYTISSASIYFAYVVGLVRRVIKPLGKEKV